jgi:hypothetical protein
MQLHLRLDLDLLAGAQQALLWANTTVLDSGQDLATFKSGRPADRVSDLLRSKSKQYFVRTQHSRALRTSPTDAAVQAL